MEPKSKAIDALINMQAAAARLNTTTEQEEAPAPTPAPLQSWADVIQSSADWYKRQSPGAKAAINLGAGITGILLLLNALDDRGKQ